jgi:hypothetical protein
MLKRMLKSYDYSLIFAVILIVRIRFGHGVQLKHDYSCDQGTE